MMAHEHGPDGDRDGRDLDKEDLRDPPVFSKPLVPETSVERFRDACRKAGIGEGKPLYTAMMMVFVAAEQAAHAARVGARGLTPEGEAEIINRIGRSVESSMRDGLQKVRLGLERRAVVLTALWIVGALSAGVAAGYGYRYVEENRFSSMILQQVRDLCVGEAVWPSNGGHACSVRIWLEPPAKSPER